MLNYYTVFFLGAIFGSFISAASYRLPRDIGLLTKRSACTKCNKPLKAKDLVPIFSCIINAFKCSACGVSISKRYILIELTTAFGACGLFYLFGNTPNFYIFFALMVALLVTIVSDFETYIMPDSMTIAALVAGFFYVHYNNISWENALGGMAAGLLVGLMMRWGYYILLKKEGLGMGDVKFLPVAGLWVGFTNLPVYFIISGLVGILTAIVWRVAFKNPVFPFGPALAAAMFLVAILTQCCNIFPLDISNIFSMGTLKQ